MSDELERLRLRHELHEQLDLLGISGGPLVDEMLGEPERALRIIRRARAARGVRNVTGFVVTLWRNRNPRPPRELERQVDELEAAVPPDLAALEHAWAREDTVVGQLVLKLIAAALVRHGGFQAMRADFERRRSEPA